MTQQRVDPAGKEKVLEIHHHIATLQGLSRRVAAIEHWKEEMENRMSAVDELLARMDTAVQKIQDNEDTEDAATAAKIEPAVVHLEAMAQQGGTPPPATSPSTPEPMTQQQPPPQ